MTQETKLSILAGVLSFGGAVGGTIVSSYFTEQRATTEFTRQRRVETVKARLSIVEQCVRARFHSPRLDLLNYFREIENRRLATLDKATARAEEFVPKVFSLEMQREFAQLQSDQMTCTQMAKLLFGPKTDEATRQISIGTWTDPTNSTLAGFFEAMISEVAYFSP